jgi:signal peptidase
MDRDQPVTEPMSALAAAAPGAAAPSIAAEPAPASVIAPPRSQPQPRARPVPAWEALSNLLLTAVCGVAIAVVLGLTVGPRFFAYETFIVRSGSMEPTIHTGSLVLVQPVQPPEVKVGDVITFRRPEDPDNTITHRVVEVRPGAPAAGQTAIPIFKTKGDANTVADPWDVQLQGIAWRVTFSVPLAGYLFAFTQQPAGRALFLIVPGVGLGVLWLHRTWLRLRRA